MGDKENMELFAAIRAKDLAKVKEALDNDANANAKHQFWETPLHVAAATGDQQITDELISRNAKPIKDANGHYPSYWAETNGHEELAKYLKNTERQLVLISVGSDAGSLRRTSAQSPHVDNCVKIKHTPSLPISERKAASKLSVIRLPTKLFTNVRLSTN